MVKEADARDMVRRAYSKGYDIDGLLESFSQWSYVMKEEWGRVSGMRHVKGATGTKAKPFQKPSYEKKITHPYKYRDPSEPYKILHPAIKKKKRKVEALIPKGMQSGLRGFAKDPHSIEYGGALDFEGKYNRIDLERALVYVGEKQEIPYKIRRKYAEDYEVLFHTHPDRERAYPSGSDVHALLCSSQQQISFIISEKDILVMEKTPDTVGCYDPLTDKYKEELDTAPHSYGERHDRTIKAFDELGLKSYRVAWDEDLKLNVTPI